MKGTKILALLMAMLVLSIGVSAIRPGVAVSDYGLVGKATERGDIEKPIVKETKQVRVEKKTFAESREQLRTAGEKILKLQNSNG